MSPSHTENRNSRGIVCACNGLRDAFLVQEAPIDDLILRFFVQSAESCSTDILGAPIIGLECLALYSEFRKSLIEPFEGLQVNSFRGVPERADSINADTMNIIIANLSCSNRKSEIR
jgi:hypothetical protein